jgi:hypothetical protein
MLPRLLLPHWRESVIYCLSQDAIKLSQISFAKMVEVLF